MLNAKLQEVWDRATPDDREIALRTATLVLENLTHYPTSPKKRYYADDRLVVAATLLLHHEAVTMRPASEVN